MTPERMTLDELEYEIDKLDRKLTELRGEYQRKLDELAARRDVAFARKEKRGE